MTFFSYVSSKEQVQHWKLLAGAPMWRALPLGRAQSTSNQQFPRFCLIEWLPQKFYLSWIWRVWCKLILQVTHRWAIMVGDQMSSRPNAPVLLQHRANCTDLLLKKSVKHIGVNERKWHSSAINLISNQWRSFSKWLHDSFIRAIMTKFLRILAYFESFPGSADLSSSRNSRSGFKSQRTQCQCRCC